MTFSVFDRATTIKKAFRACNVEPLVGEAIARYYVDLSAVRKTEAIEGKPIAPLTYLDPRSPQNELRYWKAY